MERRARLAVLTAARQVGERQQGVVLAAQLQECGVGRGMRARLVAEGWLTPLRRTAWALGPTEPSDWQSAVAVWLTAGPTAALSHASAARVHKLPVAVGTLPEVTVVLPSHPRPADAVVHRVAILSPSDVTEHRGVPVTSAERTMIDIAGRLEPVALARVLDEGFVSRHWDHSSLSSALARVGGRPGLVHLRQLLGERGANPAGDSLLEARVIEVLRAFGPFQVHHQVILDGELLVVDIAWPEIRVAVECDGWTVRSRSRSKFDHDRRRSNLLGAHQWTVVHVTASMSDEEIRSHVFRALMRAAASSA